MLDYLGMIDLGTSVSFAEQLSQQIRYNALFCGQIEGRTYLLPRATTPTQVDRALALLQETEPESEELFKQALYRLWLITKHEKISDDDKEATIRTMAESLARYPKGLGMSALAECSVEHFFPSWAHLEKKITERGGWRTQLAFWLNRARPQL